MRGIQTYIWALAAGERAGPLEKRKYPRVNKNPVYYLIKNIISNRSYRPLKIGYMLWLACRPHTITSSSRI